VVEQVEEKVVDQGRSPVSSLGCCPFLFHGKARELKEKRELGERRKEKIWG